MGANGMSYSGYVEFKKCRNPFPTTRHKLLSNVEETIERKVLKERVNLHLSLTLGTIYIIYSSATNVDIFNQFKDSGFTFVISPVYFSLLTKLL